MVTLVEELVTPVKELVTPVKELVTPVEEPATSVKELGFHSAFHPSERAGDSSEIVSDSSERAGDSSGRAGDSSERAGDSSKRAGDSSGRAGDFSERAGKQHSRLLVTLVAEKLEFRQSLKRNATNQHRSATQNHLSKARSRCSSDINVEFPKLESITGVVQSSRAVSSCSANQSEASLAAEFSGNWLDKKKNETTYWKCADLRKGCRGPTSTLDDQLTSPAPDHSHDSVFQAKQSLKGKAAQAYLPTKFPCSEAVSGLGKTEQATKQQTPLQPPKP
ncbi:hypothetical protein ACHWQZ_G000610 [Mnemiopsis leidyi]